MHSEETICQHVCIYFPQVQFLEVTSHNYDDFSGRRIEAKEMPNKTNQTAGGNCIINLMFFSSRINFTGESRLCVLSLIQFFGRALKLVERLGSHFTTF